MSTDGVENFCFRRQQTRLSGFWQSLEERGPIVAAVSPQPSRARRQYNRLRFLHVDSGLRFARATLQPSEFRRRSALAEARLAELDGQYDVIVQEHFWLAPGTRFHHRPYVVYTDMSYLTLERHTPEVTSLRGAARREWLRLEGDMYRSAAHVFTFSQLCRNSIIEEYDCPPDRVSAVGAGVTLPLASIDARRYDQRVALFVGYSFERKGGAALLRAWPRVREVLPDAQLWIVGPPPRESAEGIRWIGPVADRARIADLYDEASVFVMPSLADAWGHVFFEAMARGLPVIGADHLAMPEFIVRGENGLLVPPNDADAVAEALIQLLGSPADADRMGRAGHRRVAQGHTWRDVVARMWPHILNAAGTTEARDVEHECAPETVRAASGRL